VIGLAATRGAVGLGPGLGRSAETQAFVCELAKRLDRPLVIDADGLMPFAEVPGLLAARTAVTLLTPHPGEAAHLLGVETAEINRDRPAMARRLAERTGALVALKGAATVIAAPDGRLAINPTGGPALAAGGTGDVLLGMATALLVQRMAPFEALLAAAFVHGAAADRIARRHGPSGLLAGDLAAEIPASMQELREAGAGASGLPAEDRRLAVPFPEP